MTITQDVTQAAPDGAPAEQPRRWYFTFGHGQHLYAGGRDQENIQGAGIPLDGCYVILHGTFLGARMDMIKLFGRIWCDQYPDLPIVPGYHPWRLLDLAELMGNPR